MQIRPSIVQSRASSADDEATTANLPVKQQVGSFRKRKSDVWYYFKPKYVNEQGILMADCKLCSRPLTACNITNLKSHLTTVHKDDYVFDKVKYR